MKLIFENWRKYILKESNLINGSELGTQVHASEAYIADAIKKFQSHAKLSSFVDPSRPKPFGFYTSTLRELGNDMYGSSWNDFLKSPDGKKVRNSTSAFLLKPQTGAKILQIATTDDYENIKKKYPLTNSKWIDWNRVAQDFDAVHFTEDVAIKIGFDVEQTTWFKTDVLDVILARNDKQIEQKRIKETKEALKVYLTYPSNWEMLSIYPATLHSQQQKDSYKFRQEVLNFIKNYINNPSATTKELYNAPKPPANFYQQDRYTPEILQTIETCRDEADWYDLQYNIIHEFEDKKESHY